jgi:hypothetical protein
MEMPGSIEALAKTVEPEDPDSTRNEASREALTQDLLKRLRDPSLRGDQAARMVEVIAKINPIPEGTALKLEDMSSEELLRLASDEIAALLRLYGHEPDVLTESIEEAEVMAEATKDMRKRKLNRFKAREIRQRWCTENTSRKELAKEYGVSIETIKNLLRNKVYKDPLWKKPTREQRRATVIASARTKFSGKTKNTESPALSATSTEASET